MTNPVRVVHVDGAVEIGVVEGPGAEGTWRVLARMDRTEADAFQAEFQKARALIPEVTRGEKPKNWLVRTSLECAQQVTAVTAEEARARANEKPPIEWDETSWTEDEVELAADQVTSS